MFDAKRQVAILNTCWAWLKKYAALEKTGDDYWHNAIKIDASAIEEKNPEPFCKAVLNEMMTELAMVKDFGRQGVDIRVYYTIFSDCTQLLKMADEGFMACSEKSLELSKKYEKVYFANHFMRGMFQAVIDEIGRIINGQKGDE